MEYTNIQHRHEEFKNRYLAAKNGNDLVELHFDIMQFVQEYEETVPVCLRGADFINADSYAHFLKDLCAEKLKIIARQVQVIDPISAAALEVLTGEWLGFDEKMPEHGSGFLIPTFSGGERYAVRLNEYVKIYEGEDWKTYEISKLDKWKPLK